MFIVLYRWRIRPRMEKQFIENWSIITDFYRRNYDSLGSRLHRGNDGLFYSYAQWQTAEHRENAFAADLSVLSDAGTKMRESIEESFPEIVLEKVADYLV